MGALTGQRPAAAPTADLPLLRVQGGLVRSRLHALQVLLRSGQEARLLPLLLAAGLQRPRAVLQAARCLCGRLLERRSGGLAGDTGLVVGRPRRDTGQLAAGKTQHAQQGSGPAGPAGGLLQLPALRVGAVLSFCWPTHEPWKQ